MKKLLYASAPWCRPCKAMKPITEKFAAEAGIPVEHLDIEAEPKRGFELKVMSLPTLIVYDGEAEVRRTAGQTTPDKLRAFITA